MPKKSAIRAEFSYEELLQQLGEDATPAQQEFVQAIREAEERMTLLHQPDKTGRIPLLDEKGKLELMELHRNIGKKAEMLLPAEKDPERKKLVSKLNALASNNYAQLLSYDPRHPKTLPTLLEDVRTMTVDLRSISLDGTQKGGLNSRQPITFMNVDGKSVSGLFTPKREARHIQDFQKMLDEACKKIENPKARQMMKEFPKKYREKVEKQCRERGDPIPSKETIFHEMINDLGGSYDGSSFDWYKVKDGIVGLPQSVYPDPDAADEVSSEFYSTIRNYISRNNLYTVTGAEYDLAGIPEKEEGETQTRIDNRNAAMSTVADLLGRPSLVARARQMKVINSDGKTVDGTFMLRAKGEDVNNPTEKVKNLNEEAGEKTDGKGFRDLADLQVLDYICGNVDRHPGNVFLEFDENGKLCGAQGIDDDCSLGLLIPEDDNNVKSMVAPKNMRVVSQSMYNKVMKMNPAELKFALRGYQLSEKELDAAATRLKMLQTELKKEYDAQLEEGVQPDGEIKLVQDHVRIVNDENFKQFSLKDLSFPKESSWDVEKNLFDAAASNIKNLRHNYEVDRKKKKNLPKKLNIIGEKNRAISQNLEQSVQQTNELLDSMKRVTVTGWFHWHRGSSPQFENMRKAVQNYHNLQEEILSRVNAAKDPERKNDPEVIRNGVVTEEDLKRMEQLGKEVQRTAGIYLTGKGPKERITNPYTKSRVEVAETVKLFGDKIAVLKPEEKEFGAINERRAEEAYRSACAEQGIVPREKETLIRPEQPQTIAQL